LLVGICFFRRVPIPQKEPPQVQITTILCHWYFRWTILQTATSRPTFAKRKPPSPLRAVISSQGLPG
jgi:hypothetical protein